ncbi:MAG: hypothetical protein ACI4SM_02365 [Candidatus Gastranaerophilaceae bacterium]
MHKTFKFCIEVLYNAIKTAQLLLFILVALLIADFILNILSIKLPSIIQNVFNLIYEIQCLIYKPNFKGTNIDFTLIITSVEILFFALALNLGQKVLTKLDKLCDKFQLKSDKIYEENFNVELDQNYRKKAVLSKKFVILFNVKMEQAFQNFIPESKRINIPETCEQYKVMLANYIKQLFNVNVSRSGSDMIAFFDNFDICDDVFEKIQDFGNKVKQDMAQKDIKFKIVSAVELADELTPKSKYLPKLKKLLQCSKANRIIALGTFKSRYQCKKVKKSKIKGIGTYSIDNEIFEVYTIETAV